MKQEAQRAACFSDLTGMCHLYLWHLSLLTYALHHLPKDAIPYLLPIRAPSDFVTSSFMPVVAHSFLAYGKSSHCFAPSDSA